LRELLKHRKLLYLLSGLVGFVIVLVVGVNLLVSERRELNQMKDQRKEMMMLKDEFLSLRQRINFVEGKKNLSNVQGIVQAVDEVFSSVGLRDKVKTVKSAGKRETRDGFEEEADIFVEKVSMNEMANIFYRIERAPMVLTIKKATIKKSFESPELLNLTLVISFLKAK
jgi:general secretion pathway protein M